MPEMNELELAQAVKAILPTTHVVILTGDPSAAQAVIGVDDMLTKPFRLAELRQIVGAALNVG